MQEVAIQVDSMYIKEFLDLVKTCNYQKTADNMNISTSSLSKHIHKMEAELKVPLFDRTTRTVKISEYGLVFYEYAQKFDALAAECRTELNRLRSKAAITLMVGYSQVMLEYGFLEAVSDFVNLHPEAGIRVVEEERPLELFDTENCDLVFSDDEQPGSTSLSRSLYFRDNLAVLLPEDHPLATQSQISVEQLRDEKFIFHGSSETQLYKDSRSLIKLFHDVGLEPNIFLVSSRCAAIAKAVSRGAGVAVLFRHQIPARFDNLALVDLYPFSYSDVYVFTRKNRKISPIGEEFLQFIKKQNLPFSSR